MQDVFLEVSYRRGKPFAAYLYLQRSSAAKVARTQEIFEGLLADFDARGRVLGVEIVNPASTSVTEVRAALTKLRVRGVSLKDLAPLRAA